MAGDEDYPAMSCSRFDRIREGQHTQPAFFEAGGEGPPPSDELMYQPIRACFVTDPFGTELMIYAPLEG